MAKEVKVLVACGSGVATSTIAYARISAADGSIQTGLYTWTNDVSVPALLGIENDITTAVAEATETLDEKLGEVVAKSDVELTINDPEAHQSLLHQIIYLQRHRLQVKHQIIHLQ